MKTSSNLIEQIYDFENLYRAWLRAAQGQSRARRKVMRYGLHLEEESDRTAEPTLVLGHLQKQGETALHAA